MRSMANAPRYAQPEEPNENEKKVTPPPKRQKRLTGSETEAGPAGHPPRHDRPSQMPSC